jgi:hypothetical protein
LSLAAPAQPVLRITEGEDGTTTAEAVVVISNAGGRATNVRFFLYLDENSAVPTTRSKLIDTGRNFQGTIGVQKVVDLRLSFPVPDGYFPTDASLEMAAGRGRGTNLDFRELKIERLIEGNLFWTPVRWGIGGALVVLALTFLAILIRKGQEFPAPNRAIYTASAWSFSDSWATNITVIGGLLTAVLGATDVLGEILPGVSMERFLALSLLFTAIAAGAPLVYIAFGRRETANSTPPVEVTRGTFGGLLAAAAITSVAVFGQLRTIAVLVQLSNSPSTVRAALLIVVAAAGVAVALYAVRSLQWLIRAVESTPAAARMASAPAGPGARAAGAI